MPITATTHINLPGTAREALGLYAEAFGGRVHVTTYADLGMPQDQPGADRVVFGRVDAEDGFRLMAYDVPGEAPAVATGSARREQGLTFTDQPFFVAVGGESLDALAGPWQALGEGGTIVEALAPSAWSPGFGMLTDRYGVTWTFAVDAPGA